MKVFIFSGFDRAVQPGYASPMDSAALAAPKPGVIPFPANRPVRPSGTVARPSGASQPAQPRQTGEPRTGSQDLSDMEIPTFIRRQMD